MKNKALNICKILFILYLMNISLVNAQENYDSLKTAVVAGEEGYIGDSLVDVAFGEVPKTDLVGAISTVNFKALYKKSYSADGIGDVIGLTGGYTGNIWGQSPLVLIDGIPRSINTIHSSEIASVTILKGANAVVLYGSKAAKGVVLITTKRGQVSPLKVDVTANGGLFVPKAYPNYLDAASYMTLYNEACRNDGITEKYSQEDIYNTYSGKNPYKYPDLDFYSAEYLRKAYNQSDVIAEIYGGTEKTRYYTNFGMLYNNELINYGEYKNNNNQNFHLRTNVDMQLTDWLSASTDVGVVFNNDYTGRGNFWNDAATLRPNRVSPLVPISMFDPNNASLQTMVENSNHVIDGMFLPGGSSVVQSNVFGDMLAAGYIKNKHRLFQFKQAVDADLGSILEGLSFNTFFGVDYNDYYSEAFRYTYAVFEPSWSSMNGKDMIIGLQKYNEDTKSSNEYIGATSYDQTMTFSSRLNYKQSFADQHNVDVKLLGWGYQVQNSADGDHNGSQYHRISNLNLGLQVSYNYRHKYYLDLAGTMVHSAKLPKGNRDAFSPSATIGWRLSDESFFRNNLSFINNMKIYASYALLNQDLDIDEYYMYKGYFDNKGGWYTWLDGAAGGFTTTSERGNNPNLSFIQRKEISAGLSASFFENLIDLNANYFQQYTDGLLTQGASTVFPSYYSTYSESFLPYINYNNDKRSGVDFNLNLNQNVGKLRYTAGVSGMFYTSEAAKRDEVYEYDYQYRAGKPLDATWGYICEGFFVDQNDINNHAVQTFGEVQPGDLKYKDVNEDGVVDSKDAVDLGKSGWSAPPFSYGIHLSLQWNKITLFALGTGVTGATRFKGGSYYHVYGERKYSEVVLGRWNEQNRATATYPRLTTTENTNNFRNSTFWKYEYNRFDLSKIQITYDLSDYFSKSSAIKRLSAYLSGENLLTVSKERELMITSIGSAPQVRFYNIGVKVSF